ncbi:cysteine-rich receptor kinase 2, partial [Olea europaea subsp. europaea]
MASSAVTQWWLSLISWVVVVLSISKQATAQPQINLLNRGCSQYNATNIRNFFDNLNATFSDLRNQLSNESKLFATAQQSRSSDPVYAMVQCRNYLSNSDCLACYDAAVAQIRNCSAANGARVIYDGCFLRYESNSFYDQTTLPGNVQICSNRTASPAVAFNAAAETLLQNLELATPRISGYFAATNTEVGNGGPTIYGVAQCAETISQSGCQDCLTVAYRNIIGCLPNADGRAIDAACFIRYSNTAFFAENQTINITPFLGGGGGSSKKNAIIGGVVGGAGLVLIIAALFLWYHLSRKQKVAARGNILGATELQGPNTYNYKDLKSATNNFSEKNKIGEGGFGDVYKATLQNGNIIAVKKLDLSISRAKADFETEVRLISNVHHRNLVRLLGCCTKGGQLLLIYEFMPNGSLDRYLFAPILVTNHYHTTATCTTPPQPYTIVCTVTTSINKTNTTSATCNTTKNNHHHRRLHRTTNKSYHHLLHGTTTTTNKASTKKCLPPHHHLYSSTATNHHWHRRGRQTNTTKHTAKTNLLPIKTTTTNFIRFSATYNHHYIIPPQPLTTKQIANNQNNKKTNQNKFCDLSP